MAHRNGGGSRAICLVRRTALFAALVADTASALNLGKIGAAQTSALRYIVSANHMYASEPFEADFASVAAFVPEEPKMDSSELGLEGARALAETRQEAAPKGDVAWCSAVSSEQFCSLTAWNTPQIYVPHLYWACGLVDGGESIAITLDMRPRADAGYDTMLPDGSFPEPDSREAFMKASTRKELADSYFTADAVEWVQSLRDGATALAQPTVPYACAGPLLLDVVLPLSDAAIDMACDACEGAASLWLDWMASAEKLDSRRTMTVFAHDAKTRALCLATTTAGLEARFGTDGRTLALADAGPLDITDRGSAQNAAAESNFGDEEKDGVIKDMLALASQGRTPTEDQSPSKA